MISAFFRFLKMEQAIEELLNSIWKSRISIEDDHLKNVLLQFRTIQDRLEDRNKKEGEKSLLERCIKDKVPLNRFPGFKNEVLNLLANPYNERDDIDNVNTETILKLMSIQFQGLAKAIIALNLTIQKLKNDLRCYTTPKIFEICSTFIVDFSKQHRTDVGKNNDELYITVSNDNQSEIAIRNTLKETVEKIKSSFNSMTATKPSSAINANKPSSAKISTETSSINAIKPSSTVSSKLANPCSSVVSTMTTPSSNVTLNHSLTIISDGCNDNSYMIKASPASMPSKLLSFGEENMLHDTQVDSFIEKSFFEGKGIISERGIVVRNEKAINLDNANGNAQQRPIHKIYSHQQSDNLRQPTNLQTELQSNVQPTLQSNLQPDLQQSRQPANLQQYWQPTNAHYYPDNVQSNFHQYPENVQSNSHQCSDNVQSNSHQYSDNVQSDSHQYPVKVQSASTVAYNSRNLICLSNNGLNDIDKYQAYPNPRSNPYDSYMRRNKYNRR